MGTWCTNLGVGMTLRADLMACWVGLIGFCLVVGMGEASVSMDGAIGVGWNQMLAAGSVVADAATGSGWWAWEGVVGLE